MNAASCPPPDSWNRPPVARGEGAFAGCGDEPPAPVIDVAALSVGLPDGVYYAGKRLLPWMSFDERLRIEFSEHRHVPADNAALLRYRASESVVVRWTIENGTAGATDPFINPYREGNEREGMRAFIWGTETGHVDVYHLPNALLRDAIPKGHDRPGSDAYGEAVREITRAFGDEWLLPAIEIRRAAARLDLLAAERVLDAAIDLATKDGVDAAEILGWTKSGRKP